MTHRRPPWLSWLLLAVVYVSAAKLGLSMAFLQRSVSPVWPPTGIALAAVLLLGYRAWPGIWLGAFLANAMTPMPLAIALSISVGNTLEALSGAFLIKRYLGQQPSFHQAQDVLKFVASAAIASCVAATIGTLSLALGGAAPWAGLGILWLTWWLGDLMGAIVITPLVLSWRASRPTSWQPSRLLKGTLVMVLLLLTCQLVFGGWPTPHSRQAYLILPMLVWAAFWLGPPGVCAAIALTSGIAIRGTIMGFGPFVATTPNESLLLLQGFVGVVGVSTLLLAAVIAERRKVEAEIRRSEAKFRGLLHAAPDAIVVVEAQGGIVYVSAQAEQIFGYESAELIGKTVEQLICQSHQDPYVTMRNASFAQQGPEHRATLDLMITHKDGREVPVELSLSVMETAEETLAITILRDISARKQVEEALSRLASLVHYSNDAIITASLKDTTVATWNPAAERIFGYSAAEIVGRPVSVLFPPDRLVELENTLRTLRKGEALAPFESVRIRKDGHPIDVSVSPSAIPGASGRPVTILAIVRDISQRKQTESELARLREVEELNRLKDTFLSAISHEMKTPLSIISGYAELLEEKLPDDEMVQGILDGSRRITSHLNHIVDYSALLSGALPLYRTMVAPAEIVEIARESLEDDREFRLKGLHLVIEIHPETPTIEGDSRRITQMLFELLDNAKKFTPDGGSIGIRVMPSDGFVQFEVWDTGGGIPEADRATLWEAFATGKSIPVGLGGLGLGLAIIKKLAELHGGRVAFESQVGKGSRFFICLPTGQAEGAPPGLKVTTFPHEGTKVRPPSKST